MAGFVAVMAVGVVMGMVAAGALMPRMRKIPAPFRVWYRSEEEAERNRCRPCKACLALTREK